MNNPKNLRRWIFGSISLLILVALGVVWYLRLPYQTPELKGKRLAEELGCFACHGSGGLEGASNPGAEGGEVPAWSGGTAMMYLNSDKDIHDYILHGHLESSEHSHEEHGLLKMPAYSDRITHDDLNNLTAYVKAVSRFYPNMPSDYKNGIRVASKYGCFGCHGPSGRGGVSNPGSFKGIIPGWNGKDFKETVKNKNELKSWILKGITPRFDNNPAAKFFIDRAILKMPAYENKIEDSELKDLMETIWWIQSQE